MKARISRRLARYARMRWWSPRIPRSRSSSSGRVRDPGGERERPPGTSLEVRIETPGDERAEERGLHTARVSGQGPGPECIEHGRKPRGATESEIHGKAVQQHRGHARGHEEQHRGAPRHRNLNGPQSGEEQREEGRARAEHPLSRVVHEAETRSQVLGVSESDVGIVGGEAAEAEEGDSGQDGQEETVKSLRVTTAGG